MTLSDEVKALEALIIGNGVSVDAVLSEASVDRSTWTRWKNSSVKGARYDTIQRVRDAAKRLSPRPEITGAAA